MLRAVLHSQDVNKFELLLRDGLDVNAVVDNVFWETPLMYAVKHGHLEIVEKLLANGRCRLDCHDRSGHTALDEAVGVWLLGATGLSTESKQYRGRRFRVLRCVVAAGAARLATSSLDNILYSCHNSRSGLNAVDKLVRVVCQRGAPQLKTDLLLALLSHAKMSRCLRCLLISGADPLRFANATFLCQHIPEENAIVLIKASNDEGILGKIERYMRLPRALNENRPAGVAISLPTIRGSGSLRPREAIHLLLLSTHSLNLQTLHYLRRHQAALYKLAVTFIREPRPLRYLARVVVRKHCSPNVYAAVKQLRGVPLSVKTFLIFEEEERDLEQSRK